MIEMKRATMKADTSTVDWFGYDYPYYHEDAKDNLINIGEEVLIVHEAGSNPAGKLFVVYNERNKQSATISEIYLDFK